MRTTSSWAALAASAFVLSVPLVGCDTERDGAEDMPDVVEVEPSSDAGARELEEEMLLGPGDEGKTIIATGWVEGKPLDSGFFLRTEFDRLVFIVSGRTVASGDAVRATGMVRKSDADRFDGWEREALGEDLKPDLDLWRGIHLVAEDVETLEEGALPERDEADHEPGRN